MTPLKSVIQLSLVLLLVTIASAKPKPEIVTAPHSFECSGSTSNSCQGKMCTVQCSDGHKVEIV